MRTLATFSLLTLFVLIPQTSTASDDSDVDIVSTMGNLERFSHKLNLAIEHANWPLASFYEHELEETLEAASDIERYHDQPIGALVDSIMMPAFEGLAEAVDNAKAAPESVEPAFNDYVAACNACHEATGHEFIRIERNKSNPFMQSFSTQSD